MSHMSGAIQQHRDVLTIPEKAIPVAVLDVSDGAAILNVATNAYLEACSKREPTSMAMRAALTALGVLPKRKSK